MKTLVHSGIEFATINAQVGGTCSMHAWCNMMEVQIGRKHGVRVNIDAGELWNRTLELGYSNAGRGMMTNPNAVADLIELGQKVYAVSELDAYKVELYPRHTHILDDGKMVAVLKTGQPLMLQLPVLERDELAWYSFGNRPQFQRNRCNLMDEIVWIDGADRQTGSHVICVSGLFEDEDGELYTSLLNSWGQFDYSEDRQWIKLEDAMRADGFAAFTMAKL